MQTVVFDFDGVIHSYTSGWQGESTIPDPPVNGIGKALKEVKEAGYRIAVVSTRCRTLEGKAAIWDWLNKYDLMQYVGHDNVLTEKPPAIVYIDDRAICFDGNPQGLLEKIKSFKPWNVK